MKKLYCLDEDEVSSIDAKLNDIIFRLRKLESVQHYDIIHSLTSAIEIREIMFGEEI